MNLLKMAIKLVSMEELSRKRNGLLNLRTQYLLERRQPNVARVFLEKITFLRDEDYIPIVKMCAEYGQINLVAIVLNKMKINISKKGACRMAAIICSKKNNKASEVFFKELEKEFNNNFHNKVLLSEQQRM